MSDNDKLSEIQVYIQSKLSSANLAASTIKNRVGVLHKLSLNFPNANDFSFLNDTKAVSKWLKQFKVPTQVSYVFIIQGAIKTDPNIITDEAKRYYYDLQSRLIPQKEVIRAHPVKSAKQEVTLARPLTEVQDMYDHILDGWLKSHQIKKYKFIKSQWKRISDKTEFIKQLQELVMLGCYILQPALRNDWVTLNLAKSVTATNRTNNWLVIRGDRMILILNDFKNIAQMGPQEIEVQSQRLKNLIKLWLTALEYTLGTKPTKLLYYSRQLKELKLLDDPASMSRVLPIVSKRWFNVPYTINDFRHLWEIYIQTNPEYANMSAAQKVELHRQLLHGPRVAVEYNIKE
jgi:hypothetical protein